MTPEQKEWIKAQESLITIRPARKPRPPADLTRRYIYWLVLSPALEQVILGAIVINTVALAAPYHGMPPSYSSGLENLNDGLAALFTLESEQLSACSRLLPTHCHHSFPLRHCAVIAKIYAFGLRAYFADPWSRFDAAVVFFSDLGIVLTVAGGFSVGAIGTLARVLRLGRVVRLAKALKGLRQMVSTLIISLPQLFNVGALRTLNPSLSSAHNAAPPPTLH